MSKRKFTADSRTDNIAKRAKILGAKLAVSSLFRGRRIARYRTYNNGPEVKYWDTSINFNIGNSGAPFVTLLNGISEGSDNTQRIGRKILIKALEYNLTIANTPGNLATSANFSSASDNVRCAIVWDKQADGVTPTVATVWNLPGLIPQDPMAPINMNNVDRYVVIRDWKMNLNPNGTSSRSIKGKIKLAIETRYQNVGGSYGDVASNSLSLIFYDSNTLGTLNSTLVGVFRVTFTDE